jgi:hypothetical protein
MPNQVLDIYKNRRGQFKDIRIWSSSDLGTCRREDIIVTDANYNPIDNITLIERELLESDSIYINNVINTICKKECLVDHTRVIDKMVEKSLESKVERNYEFVGI